MVLDVYKTYLSLTGMTSENAQLVCVTDIIHVI